MSGSTGNVRCPGGAGTSPASQDFPVLQLGEEDPRMEQMTAPTHY